MRRINPKIYLPYISAMAQAVNIAIAATLLMGWHGLVSGAISGVLISVTMAYASSQYSDIAKTRKPYALALMVFIGLAAPVFVGTGIYLSLPEIIHPVWRGVVGGLWGALPDASVLLAGFTAGRGMVAKDAPETTVQVSETSETPKKSKPKPSKVARKPISKDELIAEIRRNPGASNAEIGRNLGTSGQNIGSRRAKLTPQELGLNVSR